GVFEVVGPDTCADHEKPSTCSTRAKVVEVFAQAGYEFRAGEFLSIAGQGVRGERSLDFLIPRNDDPPDLGGTLMVVWTNPEDRRVFIDALEQAGLRPSTAAR